MNKISRKQKLTTKLINHLISMSNESQSGMVEHFDATETGLCLIINKKGDVSWATRLTVSDKKSFINSVATLTSH